MFIKIIIFIVPEKPLTGSGQLSIYLFIYLFICYHTGGIRQPLVSATSYAKGSLEALQHRPQKFKFAIQSSSTTHNNFSPLLPRTKFNRNSENQSGCKGLLSIKKMHCKSPKTFDRN